MSETGAFDLSSFDAGIEAQERGIEVEIKGPDGKPLGPNGWRVTVAGPDSKRFRAAAAQINQERVDSETLEISAAELQANQVRILAKCTISWTSIVLGGQFLECTEANAIRLYERYNFIREQVERKAGRRSNFFRESASASAAPLEPPTKESAT